MELAGKTIGVAMSGSFCTYENAFQELQKLVEAGAKVQTIFSEAAQTIDSRFGKAEEFVRRAEILTGRTPMLTIAEAEPIGPKSLLYLLIVLQSYFLYMAKQSKDPKDFWAQSAPLLQL